MQESRVCSLHFPRLSGWAFGACSQQPKPQNLGVPVVYFPRVNAILAHAQALLWVRDRFKIKEKYISARHTSIYYHQNTSGLTGTKHE